MSFGIASSFWGSCVRAFLFAAIASHVSWIICLRRSLFRRGSRRAVLEAAARLRTACCIFAAWHVSQVCVPSSFTEGRLEIRRARQTQGGVRQGIRHLTLVSDYYHYRVEMHIASIASIHNLYIYISADPGRCKGECARE